MSTVLELTEKQIEEIFNLTKGRPYGGFALVEDEGWTGSGKYQDGSIIFSSEGQEATGPYYRAVAQRNGSYFTDYNYKYFTDCIQQVELVEETIVVKRWKTV